MIMCKEDIVFSQLNNHNLPNNNQTYIFIPNSKQGVVVSRVADEPKHTTRFHRKNWTVY